MVKDKQSRGPRAATTARVFAFLVVICLVECAAGSCLSYGHSCWGAHGKRSGKPPAAAPDWYLTRILRRMAASAEMKHAQNAPSNRNDLSAIFQVDEADSPTSDKLVNDSAEGPVELQYRNSEAKPMLDDDMLSKIKLANYEGFIRRQVN